MCWPESSCLPGNLVCGCPAVMLCLLAAPCPNCWRTMQLIPQVNHLGLCWLSLFRQHSDLVEMGGLWIDCVFVWSVFYEGESNHLESIQWKQKNFGNLP